jgi:hypothetical protein
LSELKRTLPKWILLVSGLFALLELLVSVSLFVAPEAVMESVDFTAKGVDELFHMWATRQLALGVILAFATWKKSVPMLSLSYLFLLIVFLGDVYLGITKQELPLIISGLVMSGVAGGLLSVLKKYY